MTAITLEDILNKVDKATSHILILELLSVWRSIKREIVGMTTGEEYTKDIEKMRSEEGQDYVDGYTGACNDWVFSMEGQLYSISQRIFELMDIWDIVEIKPDIYKEALNEYANDERDLEKFISTIKQNIRELFVPSLKR